MKKVFIFILVGLIGLVGFIYNEFNGNPISKYFVKKEIQSYLSTNYGDKNLDIVKIQYNSRIKNYNTTVKLKKEGIEYSIEKLEDGSYYDGYYNAEIINPRFSRRMGEELRGFIYKDLKDKVSDISNIAVKFEIKGGKYPMNMEYTKEIEEKPEIIIELQGSGITQKEFLDRTFLIKEHIISEGYKPRGVHFRFNKVGENAGLIYSMKLEENQLNLSREQFNSVNAHYDERLKEELKKRIAKNTLLRGAYILSGFLITLAVGLFISFFEKRRSTNQLNN
ncbi:hypothetical protein [Clostridium sp. UBA4548]|uniref:YfjL-like protein n=1 Tax=Clostridium sp. UBA4548 TaxID=1946361 RepID=UPI0025BF7BB5|nr:hypothetical protein [Clostridium sp. UBA4548]